VAEFGDSATLQVGDVAYAIGNPLGEELRGTMTDGIISAIDRTVTVEDGEMTLIQTTAALNSGNSGGALINCYGQVVGITNMKMMSNWETIEGLGFAIPTATAKEVVDQLIEKGRYSGAPMLGITGSTAWATKDCPAGAYVVSVEPKSDAYAKGVRAGQIIIGANGQTVTCFEDLQEAKEGLDIGDEIELEIWTETGTSKVRVALVGRNDLD
jgi:serine protease Do